MIYTVTLNPALDRELTVAELSFDTPLRARSSRVDVGGKGFNVSRVLAALGTTSVALGFAGGRTGEALRDGLLALSIPTDFIWIAGETRTNVSIVTEKGDHYLKVNEPGPDVNATDLAALRSRIGHLASPGDWWVLAGSLPPGVPSSFYADLIGDLRAIGALVALDTSGAALTLGCAAGPNLVKPNAAEAAELTGRPVVSPTDAMRAAGAVRNIATVAISLGAAGAFLTHHGQGWLASPPAICERNPIGAGDAMLAGLIWGLSKGEPDEALRWAVACGAAAAATAGTGIAPREEIERLAAQVQLKGVAPL
jgi:1-phosphofructokinase family hexose kinase